MDIGDSAQAILFLYIYIASSHCTGLFSNKLNKFVEENKSIQHLIGFLLIFMLLSTSKVKLSTSIGYSLASYIFFIITTKLDVQWNIIVITLLLATYMYDTYINEKKEELMKDNILTEEEKNKIIKENKKHVSGIIVGIVTITMIGMLLYGNKKQMQYGGSFDITKFFLA